MSNKMGSLPLKRNCNLLTELFASSEHQNTVPSDSSPIDLSRKCVLNLDESYLIPGKMITLE